MDDSSILWRQQGGVIALVLNRPQRRNALATVHWLALDEALQRAERAATEGVARLLCVEGAAGAFCAGADIDELRQTLSDPHQLLANAAIVQRCQLRLERLSLTTLALIDGACVGGGLGLALACDLRLATPRSQFALSPARLGLVYSVDDTRRLVHTVGMARAKQMLLTGDAIDAATAAQWGLISRCLPATGADAVVETFKQALLATSGSARRGIKQVLAHVGGDPQVSAKQALALFEDAFASVDFVEGAAAFLDKRPARFS